MEPHEIFEIGDLLFLWGIFRSPPLTLHLPAYSSEVWHDHYLESHLQRQMWTEQDQNSVWVLMRNEDKLVTWETSKPRNLNEPLLFLVLTSMLCHTYSFLSLLELENGIKPLCKSQPALERSAPKIPSHFLLSLGFKSLLVCSNLQIMSRATSFFGYFHLCVSMSFQLWVFNSNFSLSDKTPDLLEQFWH